MADVVTLALEEMRNRGAADAAALAAMRHITYSEDEKLFGFSIGPESLARLGSVVEQYVRYCVDKPFKTLEFYHSVLE